MFWSLGNESYAGDNIEAMNVYFLLKSRMERLVHYESSYYNGAYEDTISDIETRMYAKPEDVEKYLINSLKNHIFYVNSCMIWGNSMDFSSYMELIDKYDMYHNLFYLGLY